MVWLILAVLFIILAACGKPISKLFYRENYREDVMISGRRKVFLGVTIASSFIALFLIMATSYVFIDQDKVGHLKRIYGANMPAGRVIAVDGEKGPQAEILPPGFHFRLFINVLYEVEEKDIVSVSNDHYRILTAFDGRTLPEGQYLADEWPDGMTESFLNAEYFMSPVAEGGEPRGQKGPQLSVLKPGQYRLNRYLFDVSDEVQATEIEAGSVGVIKSNVGTVYTDKAIVPKSIIESYLEASRLEISLRRTALEQELKTLESLPPVIDTVATLATPEAAPESGDQASDVVPEVGVTAIAAVAPSAPIFRTQEVIQKDLDSLRELTEDEAYSRALTNLSNPLVPKGNIGVWQEVLLPGRYYLNKLAYHVTMVDTRVQTWTYEGGYTRRYFDLTVNPDGSITQKEREDDVLQPDGAADSAIVHKVEGWDVWLDSRILVQVTPDNAPFVVASVGNLEEVENRIITPMYRSVSRNILGNRKNRVLDVIYDRQTQEAQVEAGIKPEGLKSGLIIRDVRFGDPYVPPELLIPGKRQQLAMQLQTTFDQEKVAQETRIQAEKKKAEAEQQAILMKAEIEKQAAERQKERDRLLGEGEQLRLEAVAKGQKAQEDVLGPKLTFELSVIREMLAAAKEHPELVKVPHILVTGEGGGLSGAAAILGESTLTRALTPSK
ncbi:TPA: hypothetical protein DF272_01205 [Candidatus Falkowbacteria bacterium]|nr:hypothetical protein [Candidatus Falkowbacteria bacterium]